MKPIITTLVGLWFLIPSLPAQLDTWTPPAPACRLPPAPFEGYLYVPPPVNPASPEARTMATVNVNFLAAGETLFGYTCAAWPTDAQSAMAYAANIWGSLINTSSTITVDACWATGLGSGTLGAAGPFNYYLLSSGGNTTWYPVALAETLLNNPSLESEEILAAFNSERSDWYFGTDGAVPGNKVDFVTVALHEIGHGLGFSGFEDIDDGDASEIECEGVAGEGCYGTTNNSGTWFPDIYARQVEDDNGGPLTNVSNPSTTVANLLTSGTGVNGELFFGSASVEAANGGNPAQLYTPATYAPGSTYSHFDLDQFGDELMKPLLSFGQAIHDPGLALNLLEDEGWPIDFSALPVIWVSFEARDEQDAIMLRWETSAEKNNAGFEVQRSRDGIFWETLSFEAGKGVGSVYQFRDRWPYAGLNYYRLKQLDFDGVSDISNIETAYFDGGKSVNIGLHPNPVKDVFTIAHAGFSEPLPFVITDGLGQMHYQGILQAPRAEVQIGKLPAGVYWLKVGEELPLPLVKF